MVQNILRHNLEMVKGDTLSFGFEYEFDDGEEVQELDACSFACKQNIDNTEYIFHKTIGDGITKIAETATGVQYSVRLDPEDTIELSPGTYYYDLQLTLNDDVFTILIGSLNIASGVTGTGGSNDNS